MTFKTPFTQGILICPTTHIDWDWVYTFDQYYASNSQATGSSSGRDTVQNIFNAAVSLFSRRIGFTFSVTEVGFLQRYARDNPGGITALAAAGGYPSCGTTSGAIPSSLVVRTEKRGSQATQLTVRLPFLAKAGSAETQAVTALEAPLTELAAVPSGTDTVTVDSPRALAATRIAWCRTQGG
ncbi:hypothetical protein HI113_31530 [Corallococcus exiguus]|uniref:glycoside hydrolase family 38 N-terminal domain-containing protein n=1 Tax=Corallococcus exiguus TaxID=83462 RepID=UPI001473586D|nr:hypothetical protein [Corallococcus exiguus]NNB98437.1 hypothetical protein [Corallococcus exiguus]